nr:MAG TPA: hypothetical protein [Caudoviricetes sp.]
MLSTLPFSCLTAVMPKKQSRYMLLCHSVTFLPSFWDMHFLYTVTVNRNVGSIISFHPQIQKRRPVLRTFRTEIFIYNILCLLAELCGGGGGKGLGQSVMRKRRNLFGLYVGLCRKVRKPRRTSFHRLARVCDSAVGVRPYFTFCLISVYIKGGVIQCAAEPFIFVICQIHNTAPFLLFLKLCKYNLACV